MAEEKKVKIIRTTLDDLPMGREEDLPEPGSKLEKYELPEGVNSGMLYRDVLRIAWPSLVELILTQLTSMADQIMVGRLPGQLGVQALSAVGLSTQPKFLLMTLVQSLNIGGTAMVARYRGLGDQKKANQVLRQSVIVNLVLAIFFAIMGVVFARPMVKLIAGANISETTLNYGITYFKIQMYGFVPIGMTFTLTAALRGCGDTKMPMIYNTIANVVNVVFSYLLIYGKFGFPEMDVAGASLATVIGQ
ncbi:MAG: polysaccharide biosynthesis C-terminal domain-containing protein, partial [Firmicutes bacterium]|nr:polysaccharide biosynthesis C-terminal domain-containing protein [Bacillota bacterium]